MARKYAALEMSLIDEGRYEKEVNDALKENITKLLEFKKKHGRDAARGVKAVLNMKVTIQFDGVDEGDFSVKAQISQTLPTRPPSVSKAIEESEQDGQATLWVRKSGSTEDNPRQGVLTTKAGDMVNTETGEVIENKK